MGKDGRAVKEWTCCKFGLVIFGVRSSYAVWKETEMKGRRSLSTIAVMVSMWIVASGISIAETDTKSVVIRAKIEKTAELIVHTNTITFPNMDPDKIRQVPALQNDIKVTVKARTGSTSPVDLNVIADGDLVSGPDAIPV
jgi:hypothetical protein